MTRGAIELHRRLAYVPGDTNLWPTLTGGETIDVLGRLRGGLHRDRRDELIERFDLDPEKKARAYSKGNRQKVALVAALASDAELFVLDEPTAGLDPLMEAVFQDCIIEARERGCTVLLSSHILAEVEKLCDRVTIIRRGRTVQRGTLTELRHLTRTTIDVETRRPATDLDQLPGVHDLRHEDGRVRCRRRPARRGRRATGAARGRVAHQSPAHPRGAVPASLRRGARRRRHRRRCRGP